MSCGRNETNNIVVCCYIGMMGVSNTNYTSKLFINADLVEVKEFRSRYATLLCIHLFSYINDINTLFICAFRIPQLESPSGTQVTQINPDPAYSMEDDFLNQTLFKPICELKEASEIIHKLIINHLF